MGRKTEAVKDSNSEDETKTPDKYDVILQNTSSNDESRTVESAGYSFATATSSGSQSNDTGGRSSFDHSELELESLGSLKDGWLDKACAWLDRPICLMPGIGEKSLLLKSSQLHAVAFHHGKLNEPLYLTAEREASDESRSFSEQDGSESRSEAYTFMTEDVSRVGANSAADKKESVDKKENDNKGGPLEPEDDRETSEEKESVSSKSARKEMDIDENGVPLPPSEDLEGEEIDDTEHLLDSQNSSSEESDPDQAESINEEELEDDDSASKASASISNNESSETEPIDLTNINEESNSTPEASVEDMTSSSASKIDENKDTVAARASRDLPLAQGTIRVIDDEVEREVLNLWQEEEEKLNIVSNEVESAVPSPATQRSTSARPDPIENDTLSGTRNGKDPRRGPTPEMRRTPALHLNKKKDLVEVRTIDAGQKLREARDRPEEMSQIHGLRKQPVMYYGVRPISNEDHPIDIDEYITQRELLNREANGSAAVSPRELEGQNLRSGKNSYSPSPEITTAGRSKQIFSSDVTDLTSILDDFDREKHEGQRNYYFVSSHDQRDDFDIRNSNQDPPRKDPAGHITAHNYDKRRREKRSSSSKHKADMPSVDDLKRLEKKLEKHFRRDSEKDRKSRSTVSTKELRKLEKQLVKQLQRVDEKRAAKLERLRKKKNQAADNIEKDNLEKVHIEPLSSISPTSKTTKKLADFRESNRYEQLQALRLAKEMERYMGTAKSPTNAY